MNKEELKQKGIKYACEYPSSQELGYKRLGYKRIDLRKAYIAGATENVIRFHDLQKDPNDLPKSKDVMCICLGQIVKRFYPFPTECWIGYYDALGWSDYMGNPLYSNVYYWIEIPL